MLKCIKILIMIKREIKVEKSKKILEVLADNSFSYAAAQKMLRNKDIKLNGKVCKENVKAEVGGVLTCFYKEEIKPYEIVFENDEVVLINKFAGIEVENGLDKLLHAFPVHRLDRNTEGLLVMAKTLDAKAKLEKAFKNHKIKKFYLTEVVGEFNVDKTFKAYLVKDAEKALVKIFPNKVKGAVLIQTKIKTLKAKKESSLLEVEIIGGKTHQIRAHLAYLGHAIIGDGKYGRREDFVRFKEKRQKLFAYKLVFQDIGIEGLDGKEFVIFPKWLDKVSIN